MDETDPDHCPQGASGLVWEKGKDEQRRALRSIRRGRYFGGKRVGWGEGHLAGGGVAILPGVTREDLTPRGA